MEIVIAVANAVIASTAVIAAIYAHRQWRSQKEQEELACASGLNVSWCGYYPNEPSKDKEYGVIIHNSSRNSYHSIHIVGELKDKEVAVSIESIPPGKYFSSHQWEKGQWGVVRFIATENHDYQPFLIAKDRRIKSVEYSDLHGRRWRWEPGAMLVRI